jgi:hypothetical protein
MLLWYAWVLSFAIRAQEYQKELLKIVAELARRIDFGLAIFHLISSFASKSLSWAISLVGAPNDPATALRLLVKVHRHGGMRGQLASLLLLALPPHLQQLIPAAIDSRASPTALVALIETHVHMRIPKSPFLYWCVAVLKPPRCVCDGGYTWSPRQLTAFPFSLVLPTVTGCWRAAQEPVRTSRRRG